MRLCFGKLGFDPRDLGPGVCGRARIEPAERVEQVAVALGVEQPAVVMLAVDFHHEIAELAHQPRRDRGCADEGAAAAVAFQGPADGQRLARLDEYALLLEQAVDGVIAGQIELGGDRGRFLPRTDQPGIGPRAERQSERVEQD